MEKIHAEERKMWEAERDKDKEKIAQAVREAMQEQKKQNQVGIFYPSMDLLCVFYFYFECHPNVVLGFLLTSFIRHCT